MKRTVEVFSAGCEVCSDFLSRLSSIACGSCDIKVHDTHNPEIAQRAKSLGINSLPALVVNGSLIAPSSVEWYSDQVLRESGIGMEQ
jgi:glutaredoxin 3